MKLSRLAFVGCIGLIMLESSCGKSPSGGSNTSRGSLPRATLLINNYSLEVEVASTPEQTARGLMFRESLGENEGMLFVFPQPRFLSFYMKNTLIPLSIAFLRDDGTIINIEDMKPRDASTLHWSLAECRLALEVNQGWFAKRQVRPGDRVVIPESVTQGTFVP